MFNNDELVLLSDILTQHYQVVRDSLERNKHDPLLYKVYEMKLSKISNILEHIYSKVEK